MSSATLANYQRIIFEDCDWMTEAACRNYEPRADFFVDLTGSPKAGTEAKQRALATCAKCPVIDECHEYACRIDARGIWGGMTEKERRLSQGKSWPWR